MPDTVAGGHNPPSGRVGKGFEGRLDDFHAMPFIESPGKLIEDVGVIIHLLFWVGNVVGLNVDDPPCIVLKPYVGERLQRIAPDTVQGAQRKKTGLIGVDGQPCHPVGTVSGLGKVCLDLLERTGWIPGRLEQGLSCHFGPVAVLVSHSQSDEAVLLREIHFYVYVATGRELLQDSDEGHVVVAVEFGADRQILHRVGIDFPLIRPVDPESGQAVLFREEAKAIAVFKVVAGQTKKNQVPPR